MTDGFPAPVAVADAPLAATITRVAELAGKMGRELNQVFDLRRLSEASGVPTDVVRTLLDGRPAGEPDLQPASSSASTCSGGPASNRTAAATRSRRSRTAPACRGSRPEH
ncbi:hypothetical protein GCM10010425_48300 [Streptomyces spororaveus]|uniref:ANTAR domain-containing protein n=1 Tax=Streptomyces spororaveus TaxID=284039 RepID=A0ABQ3T8C1_9ACTN|nr:hypothetical protein Sspor_22040 [Streptomyces spororaveus]